MNARFELMLLVVTELITLSCCNFSTPIAVFQRREPNTVQCFKNGDCLSDCCISTNGWIGTCVGRPQVGQICGLFTKTSDSQTNQWTWNVLNNLMSNQGSLPANNEGLWSAGNTNNNDYQNGMIMQSLQQKQPSKSIYNTNNFELSQLGNMDFSSALGYGKK